VKSQVLVFDRIERVWHGCDWKPSDEEAQKDLESRKLSDIRREIAQIWKAINALRKARQRRRNQKQEKGKAVATEPEPVADTSIDDLLAKYRTLSETNSSTGN
jgi:hypothetical protein